MSNEKMREEFEAWVKANWPNQSMDRFNPLHGVTEGEYTGFTVQHCWDAWQASRAAIEVELPSSARWYFNGAPAEAYTDGVKCWHGGVDAARSAIESAGLKVKP